MISVLLVDPASENPRSIRKLLSASSNNFKLDCASSYRSILQGFRSKTYDVCLVDSGVELGLKFFAQARSLGWTAPIVMIASNDAREAIRAIRSGVADWLVRDHLSVADIEHSICCVVEEARSVALINQRERRYLALLDNANQIVYTHNLQGAFLSINRAGELLIGYSQAEILGMNIWQLVALEDQTLMRNMIARTLDAQTQTQDEVKLVTKYDGPLLVQINTHPINHDGKTVEIQGLASTRALLPLSGAWDFQSSARQDHSRMLFEGNGVFPFKTHEDTEGFPLRDNTLASTSLLTI
jgi:PAS domain S-box-containing protein